ncbi:hypothetical protein CC80DRAFT_487472, partial [Byssothecium circinans]
MATFEVYRFHDPSLNTIKYLFNPNHRQTTSEGEPIGPIPLEQAIETFDPELDEAPSIPIAEPKPGTEIFRYQARDGADVRYQYDRTACNGKNYVVAIHREPENWRGLREEDLAVGDEPGLRRWFEERRQEGGLRGMKRRDSVLEDEEFGGRGMDVDYEDY